MPSHRSPSASAGAGSPSLAPSEPEVPPVDGDPAHGGRPRTPWVVAGVVALAALAGLVWFFLGRSGDDGADGTGADTPPPVDLESALSV